MTPLPARTRGTLLMVAAVLVLSPDALLISSVATDPWALVFWRGLITACTLTAGMAVTHGAQSFFGGWKLGLPGVVAACFFAISTVSFVHSVRMTSAANTLVIIAAMPLFAAVLTRIFTGERVSPRTWVAVTAGFSGIAIIFRGSITSGNPGGDLLALITALMMASNFVIIRRHSHLNMIPAVILSGALTTVTTVFLSGSLVPGMRDAALLLLMGAVVLPIPLAIMTVAPKLIPAAEVSLIMLLETFLGPFWVWLFLGERPPSETVLGGAVLVTTLVVHALGGGKGQNPEFRIQNPE